MGRAEPFLSPQRGEGEALRGLEPSPRTIWYGSEFEPGLRVDRGGVPAHDGGIVHPVGRHAVGAVGLLDPGGRGDGVFAPDLDGTVDAAGGLRRAADYGRVAAALLAENTDGPSFLLDGPR